MEKKQVVLLCANGTFVEYDYLEIMSCGCEACQYNPFSTIAPATIPVQLNNDDKNDLA